MTVYKLIKVWIRGSYFADFNEAAYSVNADGHLYIYNEGLPIFICSRDWSLEIGR